MRDLRNRLNKLEATYRRRGLTATAARYENPLAGIPLTMAGRLACVIELVELARRRKATGAKTYPSAAGDELLLQRCVDALEILKVRVSIEGDVESDSARQGEC